MVLNMVCYLCSSDNVLSLNVNENINNVNYSLLYCKNCENGFTYPQPTKEELDDLYSTNTYRTETGQRFNIYIEKFVNWTVERRCREITASYKKPGKILDVGCGRGLLLSHMKRNGWQVNGIEYNDETASYANQQYNVNVTTTTDYPPNSFDIITITHVLEHLNNPLEMLNEYYKLLKPGGLLIVSTPNLNSLQAKFGQRMWFHLDMPHHLFHFSEKSLSKAIIDNSFKILKIKRLSIDQDFFGWVQTINSKLTGDKNKLYDMLKQKSIKKDCSIIDKIFQILALPISCCFAVPLVLLEKIIHKSGTIEIWAKKNN